MTTEQTLQVDGGPVYVAVEGQGRPVVLIHGYLCSSGWFDQVSSLLADRHRVIRVDLRGHGRTGGSRGLDCPDQTRMLEGVLDELGVEDCVVVGHSFGADMAVSLAATSTRVAGFVILAQAPDYSYATFPAGEKLLSLPLVGAVFRLVTPKWLFARTARFGFAPEFQIPPGLLDLGYRDFKAASPRLHRVVIVDRARRLAAAPLDKLAAESGLPGLAILGELDALYDAAKTTARYEASGLRVEVVAGAGHAPNVESPGRVAELVDDFVTGLPRTAAPV